MPQDEVKRSVAAELGRRVSRVPVVGPKVAVRLHRRGLGVDALTWPEVANLVEARRPEVLSVDVFDTCVVRDLLGDDPIELAIDRVSGAADGRTSTEPLRCPVAAAADLEELLCRPVPHVASSLRRIRRAGTRVVFLSDTDRSSATLTSILAAQGILADGDRVVASCEHGASKSDGDLYPLIHPQPHHGIWHIGNNLWADVAMAQQAGLRAFAVLTAEPTRYEAAMAARPASAGPAVAAAARSARLQILAEPGETAKEKQIELVGAGVAGQALGAFVIWAARRCREEEIGQAWFLSRDGELPLQMARAMPADHWTGTRLGYLHCSRWTWQLAAATTGLDHWLEAGTATPSSFIHFGRHRTPLVSLLGRIGLEMADLERGHPLLASLPPWEPLPTDLVFAWERLLADPTIGRTVLARAEVRRALIEDYLRGIGVGPGRVALVDVGWRGRLAWSISSILREFTGAEPLHLHFGGDKVWRDADAEVRIDRFAFDGVTPPRPVTNPVSCVETLTASGRARIVRYDRRGDGSVHPVLQREIREVRTADRRLLWEGALRTAAELPSLALLDQIGCSDTPLDAEAREVLGLWWTQPVREEVEALRGLAFEGDDDGREVLPLVTPYSARELSPDDRAQRTWQEGSAALSGPLMETVIGAYRVLGRGRQAARRTLRR